MLDVKLRRHGTVSRPSDDEELLLRAALLDEDDAASAWSEWNAARNIDDMDTRSLHILPQIYANLCGLDENLAEMGRLKGTYRYNWYKNQNHLQQIRPTLIALRNEGTRPTVLDDVGLAAGYYADLGKRLVRRVDVLIPARKLSRASSSLRESGWRSHARGSQWRTITRSTYELCKPPDICLTLHTRVGDRFSGNEHLAWERAFSADIGGVPASILGPVHQLIRICEHATQRDRPATLWVADAVTVMRASGGAIDWDQILDIAHSRRRVEAVRDALDYLRGRFGTDLPNEVPRA